jgi:hypothetical protein
MRKCVFGMLMLAAVECSALMALGQANGSRSKSIATSGPAHIARLPYTAEYKISDVKTPTNGATITHETTEVWAWDSEGRRMTSSTAIPVSGEQQKPTLVQVADPVARTTSSWYSPGQTATVTAMAAPGTHTSCPPVTPQQPTVQPQKPVIEDLGTETIAGVEARGRRTTTTIPVGSIGNDAPLTRVDEMWSAIAPGIRGLTVRQTIDNPQSGKFTKELVNLNQSEPDAAVFQPPSGYEIVHKDAREPVCAGVPQVTPAAAPQPQ